MRKVNKTKLESGLLERWIADEMLALRKLLRLIFLVVFVWLRHHRIMMQHSVISKKLSEYVKTVGGKSIQIIQILVSVIIILEQSISECASSLKHEIIFQKQLKFIFIITLQLIHWLKKSPNVWIKFINSVQFF